MKLAVMSFMSKKLERFQKSDDMPWANTLIFSGSRGPTFGTLVQHKTLKRVRSDRKSLVDVGAVKGTGIGPNWRRAPDDNADDAARPPLRSPGE